MSWKEEKGFLTGDTNGDHDNGKVLTPAIARNIRHAENGRNKGQWQEEDGYLIPYGVN